MSPTIYLQPVGLALGPQTESTGDGPGAIRLAGTMVYASRFALTVREEGRVTHRRVFGVSEAADALAEVSLLGDLDERLAVRLAFARLYERGGS